MNRFIYVTDKHLEIRYAFHTLLYDLKDFEEWWKINWADHYQDYIETDSNGAVPSNEDEIPYEEIRWDLMTATELYDFAADFVMQDNVEIKQIII